MTPQLEAHKPNQGHYIWHRWQSAFSALWPAQLLLYIVTLAYKRISGFSGDVINRSKAAAGLPGVDSGEGGGSFGV